MAYLENDFISPIIYTWPCLHKKTTSLAQLFIDEHGVLRKRLLLPNYLYMTIAYLGNDFISPVNYTWPMAYLQIDFISPIIYTWPWRT